MKLTPEFLLELQPAKKYYDDPATEAERPACASDYRRFVYLVHESKDRSFVDENAAVQIGRTWYVWPRAVAEWACRRASTAAAAAA